MSTSNRRYVVWVGREPGIYRTWEECKAQTDRFEGARFKRFNTPSDAETAFAQWPKSRQPVTQVKVEPSKPLNDYHYTLFCDGGCHPNPGASGTGLAVMMGGNIKELWYGFHEAEGTNNRAELVGMIKGLEYCASLRSQGYISGTRKAAICCDSQYTIDCVTKWATGWRKRGWIKTDGGEIQNLALVQKAFELYEKLKNQVDIRKVKAHSGILGNELADVLATVARDHKQTEWSPRRDPITECRGFSELSSIARHKLTSWRT